MTDLLTQHFADVMDLNFTARMEEDLDSVAQGDLDWVPMLSEFYGPFHQAVNAAEKEFRPVARSAGKQ